MKEVWKTFLIDSHHIGKYSVVYIATDGTIVGLALHTLTLEQKEQLRQYYKDNYKKP